MKKIFFILSLFFLVNSSYSNGCDTLYCNPWFDSLYVNETVNFCMEPGKGVVLSDGSSIRPTIDTIYFSQQSNLGSGVFNLDTCFSYTSFAQPGTAFLRYYVQDTCGNAKTCNIFLQISCSQPVITNDADSVYGNLPGNVINVLGNDIVESQGGSPTLTIVSGPNSGTASVNGGNIVYDGIGGVGADTITYSLCNYCGKCDTGILVLELVECTLPLANADLISVVQGGDTAYFNVLTNDSNLVFGQVIASIVSLPTNGSLSFSGNGDVEYITSTTFFGLDSLRYRVCTDCGCDTATLYLNVSQAPCSAPDAKVDLFYAGNGVGYVGVYNVLNNDINPLGGGNLTLTVATQPLFGTATTVNNQLVYTLDSAGKADSLDVVFYSLCNDCFCDTARVTINITQNVGNGIKPTIVPDFTSVCRNDSVWINVTSNDFDLEGSYITLGDTTANILIANPSNGRVFRVDSVTLLYIPNQNYWGLDTFLYQACDNGNPRLCDQARVFVNVNHCNNPPVVVDGNNNPTDTLRITIWEDSTGTLCIRYIDADGDFVSVTPPSVSVNTIQPIPSGLTPNPCIRITPPVNYAGQEGLWVYTCDEYPLCDSVYVIITVLSRQDAPVAQNDIAVYNWDVDCTPINVIVNDSDVDLGDTLKVSSFQSTATNDGTIVSVNDSVVCYTAPASFTGVDTFTYVVCDQTGLCDTAIVIVIVPVKARDDFYTIAQETTGSFDVKLNDTRFEGEILSLCSNPVNGTATVENGAIRYVPNDNYPYNPINTISGNGVDSLCYRVCRVVDTIEICDEAMVYVTITPKPQFFIPEGFSPSGDGTNDAFVIPSVDEFPQSQLLVFNRWGDEVWRNDADGYKNDFAGNYKRNNQPLPDGTYYYIFKFNDEVNKDKIGYIIINR